MPVFLRPAQQSEPILVRIGGWGNAVPGRDAHVTIKVLGGKFHMRQRTAAVLPAPPADVILWLWFNPLTAFSIAAHT